MPVTEFFTDQLDQLREFMADPGQTVRVVFVDPDLKPVLVKMLAGLDRDPITPHVLIPCTAGFAARRSFFTVLLKELAESFRASAGELGDAGVFQPFGLTDLTRDEPGAAVLLYLGSLAEGLPDHVGSLVVVLDPAMVIDADRFRRALGWLAENAWSAWVKFLVVDDRVNPRVPEIGKLSKRAGSQTFYLPPEEMEVRARKVALSGEAVPFDSRRQAVAMMAGFAIAKQDYPAAAQAFQIQCDMAVGGGGSPSEEAQARYGLGNALLGQEECAAAEAEFGRALELALAANQLPFSALILTQLGIAVHVQGRVEQAAESFRVARESARTANVPLLEAFVLDSTANCHLRAGDTATAEARWRDALAVYDRITSDAFADLRKSGRADVQAKLDAIGHAGRRFGKRVGLPLLRGRMS